MAVPRSSCSARARAAARRAVPAGRARPARRPRGPRPPRWPRPRPPPRAVRGLRAHHHRGPTGQHLQGGQPEGFRRPGRDGHVGARQQRGQVGAAGQETGEGDRQPGARGPACQARPQRAIARHHQPDRQARERAAWPAWSASAAASSPPRAGRSAPAGSGPLSRRTCPRPSSRGFGGVVPPGASESSWAERVQVHAERNADYAARADPPELGRCPAGGADDPVVGPRGAPVEPVGDGTGHRRAHPGQLQPGGR